MATLTSTEWNVRVQCREHELGQSFNVLIFLGTVPELQDDWQTSPSLVGVHAVYTWTGDVPEEEDQEVEGFVPLQRALGRRANLPALSEEYVVPYLTKELRWRVQKADGDVVTCMESLKLVVITIKKRNRDSKPDITEYPEITEGRDGV